MGMGIAHKIRFFWERVVVAMETLQKQIHGEEDTGGGAREHRVDD
jgi:hypothetical protein